MKKRTLIWPALLILIATFITACAGKPEPASEPEAAADAPKAEAATGGLRAGDLAPDFTLPDGDGNMVNLAEQLQDNEMVALVFYHSHT
jgi:hypothetical protein